jgi:hypothetical protein
MSNRADGVRVARPLFQEARSGSTPTSALQLFLDLIDFSDAKEMNRLWHSRLPRMGTGFIKDMPFLCYGAEYDGLYHAVAIWSNPVARNLPQTEWLELRRLAIGPEAPRNTASRMLAVMARLIHRIRPEVSRLISYQDLGVHTGVIYKAAGWIPTTVNKDGTWNRPGRSRPKAQSESPKQRWEKMIYGSSNKTRTNPTKPAGAEADVPLPGRQDIRAAQRNALTQPTLWNTSTADG